MRRSLLIGLLYLFKSLSAETYIAQTEIQSKLENNFSFQMVQSLFFDCTFSKDYKSCDLVIKSLSMNGTYDESSFELKLGPNHDAQCLSALLNVPLHFQLHRDFTVKRECETFNRIQSFHNTNGQEIFSYDLLDQLVGAILAPLKYKKDSNVIVSSLYFPLKTKVTLSPNLVLKKRASEIFFDQELTLTGTFNKEGIETPLEVFGELSGDIKWDHSLNTSKSFELHHECDEAGSTTLFEKPLHFDYHFKLTQKS